MTEVARKLSLVSGSMEMFQIAERVESLMWEVKKLLPDLDWFAGLSFMGWEHHDVHFTPLVVIVSTFGWSAHI
jgi:2-methylcitrate synthase